MNKSNLYILVLQNNIQLDKEQLDRFCDYINRKTPFTAVLDIQNVNIPLTFENFIANGFTHVGTSQYIRELIRDRVQYNRYGIIVHAYARPISNDIFADGITHPVLYQNACLVELSISSKSYNTIYRDLTHELIHCFWHMLRIKYNMPQALDTMDTYYKDDEIEAIDGNRETNLVRLGNYWMQLKHAFAPPIIIRLIELMQEYINILLGKKKVMSRIEEWALAIKEYEGWKPGSRSFRNYNPGNLRYAGQPGAIGKDGHGFAIFGSYTDGFRALMNQLKSAASGSSEIYSPNMTLLSFYQKYAPDDDGNDSNAYAEFVAKKLNVSVQIQIKDLL